MHSGTTGPMSGGKPVVVAVPPVVEPVAPVVTPELDEVVGSAPVSDPDPADPPVDPPSPPVESSVEVVAPDDADVVESVSPEPPKVWAEPSGSTPQAASRTDAETNRRMFIAYPVAGPGIDE